MTLDGREVLPAQVWLPEGWSLRYEGGRLVTARDTANAATGSISVESTTFAMEPGPHTVTLECRLGREPKAAARLEVRPRGRPVVVR